MTERKRGRPSKPRDDEPLYEQDVDLRELMERLQNREQFAKDFLRDEANDD